MFVRLLQFIVCAVFAVTAVVCGGAHSIGNGCGRAVSADTGFSFLQNDGGSYGESEVPLQNQVPPVYEDNERNDLRQVYKHGPESCGQVAAFVSKTLSGQYSGTSLILANIRHQSPCRLLYYIGRLNT